MDPTGFTDAASAMKLYLICMDALPWGSDLEELSQRQGLTQVPTFNQGTFTYTSVLARFTGRLPGTLVPGGIGSRTSRLPHYYGWTREPGVSLFHRLAQAGWRTRIHNNLAGAMQFLPRSLRARRMQEAPAQALADWLVAPYPGLELTSSSPDGISDFYAWTDGERSADFYARDGEYIRKLQSQPMEKFFFYTNQAHWHQFRYYHKDHDLSQARAAAVDWLDGWDFEEEDAVFWVFSDHGHRCTVSCPPPDYLTWSLLRDNRRGGTSSGVPKEGWSAAMAGCDFYRFVGSLLGGEEDQAAGRKGGVGSDEAVEGVEARLPLGPVDRNRIYLAEDARGKISPFESISAVATMVDAWTGDGRPESLTQLTWLRHTHRLLAFRAPVDDPNRYEPISVNLDDPVQARLKEALAQRVEWIPGPDSMRRDFWTGVVARGRFGARRLRDTVRSQR